MTRVGAGPPWGRHRPGWMCARAMQLRTRQEFVYSVGDYNSSWPLRSHVVGTLGIGQQYNVSASILCKPRGQSH
eukprot:7260687-Prymnesium_polylepis.1